MGTFGGDCCSDNRHRKTEKEEDEELLGKGEGEEDDGVMVFEESPPCMFFPSLFLARLYFRLMERSS